VTTRRRCLLLVAAVLSFGSAASAQPVEETTTVPDSQVADAGARAAAGTLIQFNVGYEHLSNGYSPWRSAGLELRDAGVKGGVHLAVEERSRFSLLDHDVRFGVERRVASRWVFTGEGQVSPSHRISAIWGAGGQVEFIAGAGWSLHASLLRRRYRAASVDLGAIGVERYLSRYRAAYWFYRARLDGGETSASHRVQGDLYYGPLTSSAGLSVSMGDEVENLGPSGILTTAVRTAAVVGRHWMNPTWFVAYEVVVHEQGDFYTRRRIMVGLGHRF
jgi:YaiO family outer membrane protein